MLSSCFISILTLVLSPLLVSALSLSRRADVTRIVSPRAGDRISTGTDFEIRWETSKTSDDIQIELRKGSPSNISVVHMIATSTPNNGSYLWRSDDDDFLEANVYDDLPEAPTTGCDYAITISEFDTAVYSNYFAMINLNSDDGLPENATCPTGVPEDFAPPASSGDGGGGGNGEGEGDGGGDGGGGGGVSKGTLAGAVAGAAAGLLIIFAIVLLLIRRRGWFVNKEYIRQRVAIAVEERGEERRPAFIKPSEPEKPTNTNSVAPNQNFFVPEQNIPPPQQNIPTSEQNVSISVHQMPANAAEK